MVIFHRALKVLQNTHTLDLRWCVATALSTAHHLQMKSRVYLASPRFMVTTKGERGQLCTWARMTHQGERDKRVKKQVEQTKPTRVRMSVRASDDEGWQLQMGYMPDFPSSPKIIAGTGCEWLVQYHSERGTIYTWQSGLEVLILGSYLKKERASKWVREPHKWETGLRREGVSRTERRGECLKWCWSRMSY